MKTGKTLFTVIIMAILATTVAVVSCKKDEGNASNQKGYTMQQAPDIRQMEDPRSYMIDFKKKLKENKDNEAFNLEDAAWHLACLANLDFCNVNVECDDFQFDTVEMQVNVTDGIILMGDLSTAYEQMCTEIQQFRKGFNHYDQNLYYINVSIGDDGNAKIALMTSFTEASKDYVYHPWYFPDVFTGNDVCEEYLSEDSIFTWNTTAARELTRVLNPFEHHDYEIHLPGGLNQIVYFPTRNLTFDYNNTEDPYGSWFYSDSRVWALKDYDNSLYNYELDMLDMCACLDSYLALGFDNITNTQYYDEYLMCWKVNAKTYVPDNPNHLPKIHYHELHVEYGRLITPNPPGPDPNIS